MPDIFHSSETLEKPINKIAVNPVNIDKKQSHHAGERRHQLIDLSGGIDPHKLEGHTHNALSSYCFYPDNVKFVNADPKEIIILILRKHPVTNIPWLLASIVLLIAPSFVIVLPFLDQLPSGYEITLILCWYLITFAFMLENFLHWFFNVDLITDERILDLNFLSLMYREITEAHLDQIQEVTVKPAGGILSFFNFGNVVIQTAAEVPRIIFESVPNPEKVAKILRELNIQEEVEKLEGRIR
jgi:hypothetical protein